MVQEVTEYHLVIDGVHQTHVCEHWTCKKRRLVEKFSLREQYLGGQTAEEVADKVLLHEAMLAKKTPAERRAIMKQTEAENKAFDALQNAGAIKLEKRLNMLESAHKYHQRWPYDRWAKMNEMDMAAESKGVPLFGAEVQQSPEEELMDRMSADDLLEPLTDRQRYVMSKSAEGLEPRDIAADMGYASSNVVRQLKYEAKRILGAPVKSSMRRERKKDE